jgi:hypothetical protein
LIDYIAPPALNRLNRRKGRPAGMAVLVLLGVWRQNAPINVTKCVPGYPVHFDAGVKTDPAQGQKSNRNVFMVIQIFTCSSGSFFAFSSGNDQGNL